MPFGIEIFGRAAAHRARRGLYAGRQILFGNKISKDGGNKSRRKWLPNVQSKKLYSDTLGQMLSLRVTTGALRNIDKAGGLDNYLLKIQGTAEDSLKARQIRELPEKRRLEQQQQAERLRLERLAAIRSKLKQKEASQRPTPQLMETQP